MRTMYLNALLAMALVAVSGVARADIQTGGTASEIYNSTAEPVITTPAAVATTTSSTTTNADGSVTVTITTTNADGSVHTETHTTYPTTTTTTTGTNTSSNPSSGGSGSGNQMLQGVMQGLMGGMGGQGGQGGLQGLMGSGMGALTGGMNGGGQVAPGGTGAGTNGGGTPAPHVMTDAEKKAAEAKELEEKKKAAACRDANTIPVAKGSTEANPGKAKDDIVAGPDVGKDVAKPVQGPGMVASTCKRPKYEEAHPMGDGKIQSMADAEKYVGVCVQNAGQSAVNNATCQCVTLTKELGNVSAASSAWKKGIQVQGNDIPIGTPVATFNGSGGTTFGDARDWGGVSGFSHTGIYLGQNDTGVIMLHQYTKAGGGVISTIPWNQWSGGTNEAGNKYYVIANADGAWLKLLWPNQQLIEMVLLNGHPVWYLVQG